MQEELKVKISADIGDLKDNIGKGKKEVEDFGDTTDAASKEAQQAFDNIKNTTKTAMTAVGVAVAAGAAALVGLAESTREYRTAQGKLTTAFETAGISADTAKMVYEELNGVLGDSDVAVEAAGHLAKLTKNEKDLEKWTDICTGVFATFGDSLPIEGLTEAANETAKVGKLTGSLADALNWAGKSEDEFQAELDKCTDEQERQALITKTLNGLYSTAAKKYKETNKEVIASNKAGEKWNATLAKMGGYVEPVVTEVKEMGTALLKNLEEPIKDVTSWISDKFIPAITSAINWIADNQAIVVAAGVAIATTIIGVKVAAYEAKLATEGLTIATVAQKVAQEALNFVMNLNPYVLVLTALVALTAGLVAYAACIDTTIPVVNALTEEEKALVENSSKAAESFREQKAAIEESAGTVQSQSEYSKGLAEELFKLADASGKVKKEDEARAKFILNELNEAYGTEYTMIDGVIQQYGSLKDKIYEVINAKTAQSMLELHNEAYVEAIDKEDDALAALNLAYKDLEAAEGEYSTKKDEITKKIEELEEKKKKALEGGSQFAGTSIDTNIANLKRELSAYEKNVSDKKAVYDGAAADYAGYTNTINNYQSAQTAALQGNYEEAIDILAKKGKGFGEFSDVVDTETQKVLDTLYQEAIKTGIEAERIKSNFKKGVKGYTKEMVEESAKAHKDAMDKWNKTYDEAYGIGGDMGDGLKEGLLNKKSSLLSRATSLIADIWSAMRKEADSHSPSRKTMQLGSDMGAGLEIGMDNSTDDVVKTAKNMIDKTILPIETSIKDIGDFESSFNSIGGSTFSSSNINSSIDNLGWLDTLADKLTAKQGGSKPIYLMVDKRVLAEVSAEGINDITNLTGSIPLVIA